MPISPSIYKTSDIKLSNEKRLDGFEAILFTSTFETVREILLIKHARRANFLISYHPFNWDNPTSKTTIPSGRLDRIYAWGDQMKIDLKELYPNVQFLIAPPPRIACEIRNIEKSDNPDHNFGSSVDLINISIFESQKKDALESLISVLDRVSSRIRLRPHPFSIRKISEYKLLDVELDPFFSAASFSELTPAEMQKMPDKLPHDSREWIWQDCDVIISAGGTSMLEAALRGIPIIVDNRNYRNVTVAYTPYKTHLRSFLHESFVEQVFSDDDLVVAIEKLRGRQLKQETIKHLAKKYCDVYKKFNL